MSAQKEQKIGYFGRLRDWFKNGLIQDLPENIAVCEFDCRKPQCRHGEWETCEKRLPGLSGSDQEKRRAE
jgi:hypothetical protein